MHKPQKMTMRRSGTFKFKPVGEFHCGVYAGNAEIEASYEVIIECNSHLDARGFLFDQMSVKHYFDRVKEGRESCELMTIHHAEGLVAWLREERKDCPITRLQLTLSPAPYQASITVEHFPSYRQRTTHAGAGAHTLGRR